MKLSKCCILLFLCSCCHAQGNQAPATPDELQYFRFMLMNVGSIDHSPGAIKNYEDGLVRQFGLNNQESALIHAAGQRLNALLRQLRQSSQSITHGNRNLTGEDGKALQALIDKRDELIQTLSSEILNGVRPAAAGRLRSPGAIVSGAHKPK
jgi:hypothetical protein